MKLRSFQNASIRSKLVASSVVTTTIALLLACVAFVTYDLFTFREALARKLSTQAEIVGLNSVSALLFNDSDSATSTLKALRAERQILAGAIYAKDGSVFARYSQSGDNAGLRLPELPADRLDVHRFENGRLVLFRPILSDKELVGMVYLEADLAEMQTRIHQYASIAALVLIISLAAAMIFSFRLQRIISEPILHLAATARSVSRDKSYSVRATKERDDETGVLVEAFNDMLTQIQRRDTALTLEIAERQRAETELERARDAALEASQLKTAFLANMSHEIRTPLNVILGYNHLIADHLNEIGDESQRPLLEAVQRGSTRLLNTVHGILDISKIETDNFEIHPQRIELARFVDRELTDFRKLAEDKGLFLTEKIDARDAAVTFDEYCLSHAFMNLLDNAIKFTQAGGVFVWVGRDSSGQLSLEVRDTGVGIDPAYIPQLYEAFTQEKSGNTRPFEGTGLGMALTKKFLELNEATISVESQKGKGSTFAIHFSKECEHQAGKASSAGKSEVVGKSGPAEGIFPPVLNEPSPSGRPRVLVVEDDPDSQGLMRALLGNRYDVVSASSAEEARGHLAHNGSEIRMVLMDLSLKGQEDGLSLTKSLRSEARWKTLPIIAVTAHARREDRERALALGCTAYLPKPIEARELLSVMESLLKHT